MGKSLRVFPEVDPNTRRATVRCEISDDEQMSLRSGMLANFTIPRSESPLNPLPFLLMALFVKVTAQ